MKFPVRGLLLAGVAVLPLGCATTGGGDQVSNSVYATHRIVKGLEQDLGPRINQLNETAADLTSKVEQSDMQTRQLQSMLEENQIKLAALEKQLQDLTRVLYQRMGLTGPNTSSQTFTAPPPSISDPGTGTAVPAPEATASTEVTPPVEGSGNAVADYAAATKAYLGEDYAGALDQYDAYLQKYPVSDNRDSVVYWRAECLRKLNREQEAISAYQQFRQEYPSSAKVPMSLFSEAMAYQRLGQTAKAIELLKQHIRDYPVDGSTDRAKALLKTLEAGG
ncbi:MAG: hypothetical protein AMXMBFR84_18760 [Candidatus Hydrogenedentota bacterium]